MKLLLDENLSRRLVPYLQADFPGSSHVARLSLEQTSDNSIWEYAKTNGYVIVTRDADFEEISSLRGHPPQIIWLKIGNLSKAAVLNLVKNNRQWIEKALLDEGLACIELRARFPVRS